MESAYPELPGAFAFSLVVEEVTMIDSLAGTLTSVKKQQVGNFQAQAASSQMMSADQLLKPFLPTASPRSKEQSSLFIFSYQGLFFFDTAQPPSHFSLGRLFFKMRLAHIMNHLWSVSRAQRNFAFYMPPPFSLPQLAKGNDEETQAKEESKATTRQAKQQAQQAKGRKVQVPLSLSSSPLSFPLFLSSSLHSPRPHFLFLLPPLPPSIITP